MSHSEPPSPKGEKSLTVHEIQHWAQEHVGRIWFVVVVVLAIVSAIFFFPHLSLVLFGLGVLAGALVPTQVGAALHKARRIVADQSGGGRLALLIGVAVIAVVLPFFFTLWVGLLGGVALTVDQKILELLTGKRLP